MGDREGDIQESNSMNYSDAIATGALLEHPVNGPPETPQSIREATHRIETASKRNTHTN